VTCLAWDVANEATVRLATGTQDRFIQLWSFNGRELHSYFSVQLAATVPKAIGFAENAGTDILVFGIYNGNWYRFSNALRFDVID
jgi:hypothetical protein